MNLIRSARRVSALFGVAFVVVGLPCLLKAAGPQNLRIVTYNIEADVNGVTTARAGLAQVLEGIGEEKINGVAQPLDIVALQETTSNSTTVAPIVTALNSFFGTSASYAQSSFQGGQNGSATVGNGPNAIIYNSKTLTLLSSVGVGTPQGATNGEYRQVMRYEFQPISGTASNDFYVYVTHVKSSASGTAFDDENARSQEAAIIRANEATLSTAANPNPSVLYVGDFNLSGTGTVTSGSQSVSAYQTMTAAGKGQAIDPLNTNPQNNNESWDNNAAFKAILTESSTNLRFRDDLQLMSSNIYNPGGGLQYVSGSLHPFGNNGSVGEGNSVNSSSNTALNDLIANPSITASQIYADLTTASDHLPVVADYTVNSPEPTSLATGLVGIACLVLSRRARHS